MNELRRLYEGIPQKASFCEDLIQHISSTDLSLLSQPPIVDGKIIDLFELFTQTMLRGGYETTCANKWWVEVANACGISSQQIAYQTYQKYLYYYEKKVRARQTIPTQSQVGLAAPGGYLPGARMNSIPPGQIQHPQGSKLQPPHQPPTLNSMSRPQSFAGSQHGPQNPGYQPQGLVGTAVKRISAPPIHQTSSSAALYSGAPSSSSTQPEAILQAIRDLDSTDVSVVIKGLNLLTKKSFETEGPGFNLDTYPHMVLALGDLLDVVNPLAAVVQFSACRVDYADILLNPQSRSSVWVQPVPTYDNQLFRSLAAVVDENSIFLAVLNIIRNLSCDPANEAMIASSHTILKHVVSAILTCLDTHVLSEAAFLAFDIAIAVAGKIDFNGCRKQPFQNYFWLEDCSSLDVKSKKQLRVRLSDKLSASSSVQQDYLVTVEALITTVHAILRESADHGQVMRALEFFSKMSSVSDNASIFAKCPQSLLECFVDHLCTNFTNTDPLYLFSMNEVGAVGVGLAMGESIVPPANSIFRHLRPPAAQGTFFGDFCDTEVRDAAIEVLYNLCCIPRMQFRLASVQQLVPLLLRIVKASRGTSERQAMIAKTDSPIQKAINMLTLLSSKPACASRFVAVEVDICVDASSDEFLGDLVGSCATHIFSVGASAALAGIGVDTVDARDDGLAMDLV